MTMQPYHKAMISYERAFEYAREFLPEQHSTSVVLHNNIGYTQFEERQYASALEHYSKDFDLASQCSPETRTLIDTLHANAALVYPNLRRFDEEISYKLVLLDGIKRNIFKNSYCAIVIVFIVEIIFLDISLTIYLLSFEIFQAKPIHVSYISFVC